MFFLPETIVFFKAHKFQVEDDVSDIKQKNLNLGNSHKIK